MSILRQALQTEDDLPGAFDISCTIAGLADGLPQMNMTFDRFQRSSAILLALASVSLAQQFAPGNSIKTEITGQPEAANVVPPESKRLLWIIPNYRTSPTLQNYEPIPVREKFKIASQDAFDPGTIALAALFAGESQFTNGNRSFGQGVAGYGRYWGTAYADFAVGDFMTEAIFPSVLHQDPRYFRKGTGSGWSRLGYAMGQIFWTHGDSGRSQFNYSEVIGNSTAVAIGNLYYRDNRTASDAVSKLGMQLGVDMAANILKEFWPEVERKLGRKHHVASAGMPQADSLAVRH